jgi:serralysin
MPTFIETTDAAASSATAYSLGIGQSAQGQLTAGDHDWYRVDLVAGQTYTFSMTGTGVNNVQDTFLRLYSPSSVLLLSDDDALVGANSQITYTATATGTYFLDASAYSASDTGQYGISATTGTVGSFDLQMGAGVMDADASWSLVPGTGANVTYGFRASGGLAANFSQLTAAEITAVQSLLAMYSEVSGLTFTQVNPGGYTNDATVLFSNYSANDGAGAYAYFPGSTASTASAGDVYLNTSVSRTSLPAGSYSSFAIMHELGHAMGLSHPGQYNAGVGVSITYANNAQFVQDSQQYSVMSYFDESATTGVTNPNYPQTLLLHDIYALQQIYGVNTGTRAGNSTYGFHSNLGGVYDFSTNTAPALCIWDGAGNDTLDLSGFTNNQTISLVGGTFSSVGGYTSNVSIALGAVIENAIGGSGADTIVGNSAANILDGGAGIDTLSYAASTVGVYVDLSANIAIGGDAAGDTVLNFENVTGSDANDILIGSVGNNTITANAGTDYVYAGDGNDQVYGGAGNDVLFGDAGSDLIYGGAGTDYIYGGSGTNIIDGGAGTVDILITLGTNDIIYGGDGIDYIYVVPGAVTPTAYGGNDVDIYVDLSSGSNDTFYGDSGQDYFYGYAGNDVFYGGNDGDVFLGGEGNDRFSGGAGVNYAWGGNGQDMYDVTTADGVLVINDFATGGVDSIRLIGTTITNFAAVQASSTYYADTNLTIVSIDADTTVWLLGINLANLTAADFIFL